MPALGAYLENKLLGVALCNQAYSSPTHVYVALYTTDPTAADSGTEVAGGSYARAQANFVTPTGGITSNSNTISITGMPATTVSYIGLRDALTAGNLLFYGALAIPRTTQAGDTFSIVAGDLQIGLS